MDTITFACSHCNQRIEAPPELFGKAVDCPSCKGRLRVPTAEATVEQNRALMKCPICHVKVKSSNLERHVRNCQFYHQDDDKRIQEEKERKNARWQYDVQAEKDRIRKKEEEEDISRKKCYWCKKNAPDGDLPFVMERILDTKTEIQEGILGSMFGSNNYTTETTTTYTNATVMVPCCNKCIQSYQKWSNSFAIWALIASVVVTPLCVWGFWNMFPNEKMGDRLPLSLIFGGLIGLTISLCSASGISKLLFPRYLQKTIEDDPNVIALQNKGYCLGEHKGL